MKLRLLLLGCVVAAAVGAAPDCAAGDKRATFTPCNEASDTKLAVEFFAPGCNDAGTVKLRPPTAVPCVKPCGSGEWYSPAALGCSRCEPGTYSNSGGRILNAFPAIPEYFTTYCQPKPCRFWAPSEDGGYLHSGDQEGTRPVTASGWANEQVRSVLLTVVPVINPRGGKVFASYRVESERYYDGLNVFVNGSLWRPDPADKTAFLLSGVQQTWRRLEIPLPMGSTEVAFVFEKDRDQSSLPPNATVGDDRAFLRDITIEGVQMYASECTPCPAGQFGTAYGAMKCQVCPKDHFSDSGATACKPCEANAWSPPGSGACIPKLPCVADDYVATYGKCNPKTGKRTQSWKLASKMCVPDAKAAPAQREVACEMCMPGFQWDAMKQQCAGCPRSGERLNPRTAKCEYCSAGTAAVPVIDFAQGFDTFGGSLDPHFFRSRCDGECDCPAGKATCQTDGFELASVRDEADQGDKTRVILRSSYEVGAKFHATLTYTFYAASAGSIYFSYSFLHSGRGRVRFNEMAQGWVLLDGKSHPLRSRVSAPLKEGMTLAFEQRGSHTLEFVIDQDSDHAPTDRVALGLYSLRVTGDSRGATSVCQVCPRGHYCPAASASFLPCPRGTFAPTFGSAQCGACSGNSVASLPGASTCRRCPLGTGTDDDHVHCLNQCAVNFPGASYDLRTLKGKTFGPVWVNQHNAGLSRADADAVDAGRFFFSPCDYVNTLNAGLCSTRFGTPVAPSYACERLNGNRSYSLGVEPRYARNRAGALTVGFSGGDKCSHGGMERTTNITFECNPDQEGQGSLEFTKEQPHCAYHFTLTTAAACPSCTEGSFDRLEGPCKVNEKQSIRWVKKDSAANCAGGFVPPAPVEADCNRCLPAYYQRAWSDCVHGQQQRVYILKPQHNTCIDDGTALSVLRATDTFRKTTARECHMVEVKFGANPLTVTALVLLFIFMALLIVVLLVFNRYRSLQQQYESLATTADANNEMYDIKDNTTALPYPDDDRRVVVYDDAPAPAAAATDKPDAKPEGPQGPADVAPADTAAAETARAENGEHVY